MRTLALMLLVFGLSAASVIAAPATAYICAEAKDELTQNPVLMEFAYQAFGGLEYRPWAADKPCSVPTAIISMKTRAVMISTAEPPYQGHACQATLTAHVFSTQGNKVAFQRTIKDFAKTGENCLAGAFKPVTIAGQDAFAVEGAGGGQGARAGWLEFYRFDGDTIRQLKLPGLSCVWVDYDNAGTASADMENIQSSWRIAGINNDRLHLTFKIRKPKAKAKVMTSQWAFGPNGLTLVWGRTPEAFADGACL